jgi:hypothetical protein
MHPGRILRRQGLAVNPDGAGIDKKCTWKARGSGQGGNQSPAGTIRGASYVRGPPAFIVRCCSANAFALMVGEQERGETPCGCGPQVDVDGALCGRGLP